MSKSKEIVPIVCSLLSGLMLALAFPGTGWTELSWVGLVPLMLAARAVQPRRAVFLGWLAGAVFFLLSLFWLSNLAHTVEGIGFKAVSILSYVLLSFYCAVFFVPLSVLISIWTKRWGTAHWLSNLLLMIAASAVWTGSEYLRSVLFTGFPWNLLGVCHYQNHQLIQIAQWGGVYAVSALVVWMNTAIFVTVTQYTLQDRLRKYRAHTELMFGLILVALAWATGLHLFFNRPKPEPPIRLALIQPNIPQLEKWRLDHTRKIYSQLETLTRTASRVEDIDLVIWPETTLPDFIRISQTSQRLIKKLAALGTPLLVGSMDVIFGEKQTYFNSSMLYETNGIMQAKYDKQHLVPFGEYVPFPGLLRKFTPIDADFAAGNVSTKFQLRKLAPFSVLICFEDTIPSLAAKAVRGGARWLVNQTNDAWFDPSAQSEQHLAHAVFRCIENRVPMARCCNTGISCIIDSYGVIERALAARKSGFSTKELYPAPARFTPTFYTRYGDVFAKICLAVAVGVFMFLGSKSWKKHRD